MEDCECRPSGNGHHPGLPSHYGHNAHRHQEKESLWTLWTNGHHHGVTRLCAARAAKDLESDTTEAAAAPGQRLDPSDAPGQAHENHQSKPHSKPPFISWSPSTDDLAACLRCFLPCFLYTPVHKACWMMAAFSALTIARPRCTGWEQLKQIYTLLLHWRILASAVGGALTPCPTVVPFQINAKSRVLLRLGSSRHRRGSSRHWRRGLALSTSHGWQI